MIILFTEEEKEWLDKEPFNWHVVDGAPEEIRKSIEKKLATLKQQQEGPKAHE